MNKRILVTGSNGFVGKNVYLRLNKYNNTFGIGRTKSIFVDKEIDVTDKQALHDYLDEIKPEVVVHCAYYPNVEGCEIDTEKARKINVEGTSNVISWCKKSGAKLIFLSTDYVYSLNGDKLNTEKDEIGSMNVYTQNKIDNEKEIGESLIDYVILRTGFIYGYDEGGKNFLMQMIEKEGNIEVPSDQFVNPTSVDYLSRVIEKVIEKNIVGVYNSNGAESLSRFDFAKKIAEKLKLKNMPKPILTSQINYKAKRPLFCKVDSSKIFHSAGLKQDSNDICLLHIANMSKNKKEENKIYYTRNDCRGCHSKNIVKVISYGDVPIANSFMKDFPDMRKIPLNLYFCEECSLVQIIDIVPSDNLFLDYRYASSVSNKVMSHFKGLAETIKDKVNLKEREIVLEVGSNDGVLLKELKGIGIRGIGIEPSINIAKTARARGLETINSFFNLETAQDFVEKFGRAKVLTASNVFAHIDNMDEIMGAVSNVLEDNGTFVTEVHYIVPLIENFQFDNIYHEHVCEYSVLAYNNLLNRFGMELYDIEKIPIHGGSVRMFAKKMTNPERVRDSVHEIIAYEREKGFDKKEVYLRFADNVEILKKDLIEKLTKLKAQGKRIAGYGAAARGTILLNVCGIDRKYLDYVVDNSIEKQGRFIPGVGLKIVPSSKLKEDRPDCIFIIAYTYANEIMNDEKYEKWFKDAGGEFVLPNVDVFDS